MNHGQARRVLACRSVMLFVVLSAFAISTSTRADSSTGEIIDEELVSFVKNTWGFTEFTDNAVVVALDGRYAGFPLRSHLKAVVVGLEFHYLYEQERYKKAGGVLAKYAAHETIEIGLKNLEFRGVAAVASMAAWPIEFGIDLFNEAVEDSAHQQQLALYFALRRGDYSAEAILNGRDFDDVFETDRGDVTKYQGWLRPAVATYFTAARVPNMTPAQLFAEAELHWLVAESKANFINDETAIRNAFRGARPRRPIHHDRPSVVSLKRLYKYRNGVPSCFPWRDPSFRWK